MLALLGWKCRAVLMRGHKKIQRINSGKEDFMGRRLLEDTNRRLRAFQEKGGGRYPENEMLERAVQEAGL